MKRERGRGKQELGSLEPPQPCLPAAGWLAGGGAQH